jgi:hypothetical protein
LPARGGTHNPICGKTYSRSSGLVFRKKERFIRGGAVKIDASPGKSPYFEIKIKFWKEAMVVPVME